MQTLTFMGKPALLEEIKSLVSNFVKERGEEVEVREEKCQDLPKYSSLKELKEDYKQRLEDIEMGVEPLYDLDDGQLDNMMDRIKSKYENQV